MSPRVAVFWNPANAYQIGALKEVQAAADVLRIRVLPLAVRSARGARRCLCRRSSRSGAEAMLVLADRIYLHNRERIVDFAAKNRRPMMSAYRELVGGRRLDVVRAELRGHASPGSALCRTRF